MLFLTENNFTMSLSILEVCKEIRGMTKPYLSLVPKMSASQFSVTLRNIENSLSKPSTVKKFFNAFGYEGSFNDWHNPESVSFRLKTKEEIAELETWNTKNPNQIKIPN